MRKFQEHKQEYWWKEEESRLDWRMSGGGGGRRGETMRIKISYKGEQTPKCKTWRSHSSVADASSVQHLDGSQLLCVPSQKQQHNSVQPCCCYLWLSRTVPQWLTATHSQYWRCNKVPCARARIAKCHSCDPECISGGTTWIRNAPSITLCPSSVSPKHLLQFYCESQSPLENKQGRIFHVQSFASSCF